MLLSLLAQAASKTAPAQAGSLPEPVGEILHNNEKTETLIDQLNKQLGVFNLNAEVVAWLVVATVLFIVLTCFLRKLRPWLLLKIERGEETGFIRSLKLKNVELIPKHVIARTLGFLTLVLAFVLFAALLIGYLASVISIYPPTRGMADVAFGYAGDFLFAALQAVLLFIPNLISIAFIAFISWGILRITGIIARAVDAQQIYFPGFHRDWALPTFRIFRFFVIIFALIMIFPYLPGYDSPAFQGVAVFLGVLVSFGSSSAVANVIAGIMLIYMRPFKVGDRVSIGVNNIVGDVLEMSLLVTRIRTPKNEFITLPNSLILNNHLTNYSSSARKEGLYLYSTVTIGYDTPWTQIHELLLTAAKNTEGIEETPEPFVLQKSLDDFYVSYEINACTRQAENMPKIYSALHENIQNAFDEAGVEIMSPHYSNLRDGNPSTVPSVLARQNYKQPAFKVGVENAG